VFAVAFCLILRPAWLKLLDTVENANGGKESHFSGDGRSSKDEESEIDTARKQ
jgi:hypothetical protein